MKVRIHSHDLFMTGTQMDIQVPKDVGLERLRWNGKNIVDLDELKEIWVEYKDNSFILHCIQVPYSQLVPMQYKDRKKLCSDNGVYKIKTDEQINNENLLQYRKSHYPDIYDQIGAIMKYLKLQKNLTDELQELVDKIDVVKDKYK